MNLSEMTRSDAITLVRTEVLRTLRMHDSVPFPAMKMAALRKAIDLIDCRTYDGTSAERVLDAALQGLRRTGNIEHHRSWGWSIVRAKEALR